MLLVASDEIMSRKNTVYNSVLSGKKKIGVNILESALQGVGSVHF